MDSCQPTMAQAVSLAKQLNETNSLAVAIHFSAFLARYERNPAEVERFASDLIELSTRQNFAHWMAWGEISRGWARSASGETAQGISWIEDGIRDYRAAGSVLAVPSALVLKAEALHLGHRTSEAMARLEEAEALAQRTEERESFAELHRLRGVFLATMGAERAEVEASFREAIRIAQEQKSISLTKRAEESYAEYRSQKARALGRRGLRPEKISVARLPVTGSDLFGREEDIAFLDDAWANPDVNVVSIVAWAGVGKSTLVNHWLRRMAADDYHSAQLVFGWSFYGQGSTGETSSADEFIDLALSWFGDPDPRLGTAWEKGRKIGEARRTPSNLIGSGWLGAAPKSTWSPRRTAA